MKYVRLASFPDAYKAHLLKSLLDADGIPSMLLHETTNTVLSGQLGNAVDVDLCVPQEDYIRAKYILDQTRARRDTRWAEGGGTVSRWAVYLPMALMIVLALGILIFLFMNRVG